MKKVAEVEHAGYQFTVFLSGETELWIMHLLLPNKPPYYDGTRWQLAIEAGFDHDSEQAGVTICTIDSYSHQQRLWRLSVPIIMKAAKQSKEVREWIKRVEGDCP